MRSNEVLTDMLDRVGNVLNRTLKDLTTEQVMFHAPGHPNTIAWLAWHLTRVQDNVISPLTGVEHLWVSGGWHQKFGLPPDPRDTGHGHTPEQVAAVRPPDVQTLLDFYEAVYARTKAFLATQDSKTLEAPFNPGANPPRTIGDRLVGVANDNLQHAGQIAYLRGLLLGGKQGTA